MTVPVGSPEQLLYLGNVDAKTGKVMMAQPAWRFVFDLYRRLGGDTDSVAAAQSAADDAAESTYYAIGNPATFVWNSDTSGTFPAGDPTRDLSLTFYDPDGNAVAVRTLRGTLTSSAGTIAVTNVSSSGLTTAYSLVDDSAASVRADITVTLSSGKQITASLAWTAFDESVAGGTPGSGGSK